MHTVTVKNITIGEGIPKICVPIVGTHQEEIIRQAKEICQTKADLVEWRADWYADVFEIEKVKEVLDKLRNVLPDIPLLVTFRTETEGGQKQIDVQAYVSLYKEVAASGFADLIDVQLFMGDAVIGEIIRTAHPYGVKVIASNHEFQKTPAEAELIARMQHMQQLDADIMKIAVMPQNARDVLTLLSATERMYTEYADRPIITMSMAGMGVISRLCGGIFGSAVTFGAASQASAPGQVQAGELAKILSLLARYA